MLKLICDNKKYVATHMVGSEISIFPAQKANNTDHGTIVNQFIFIPNEVSNYWEENGFIVFSSCFITF